MTTFGDCGCTWYSHRLKQLVREYLDKSVQDNIDLEAVLASVVPSKYDYRPFFKAKR